MEKHVLTIEFRYNDKPRGEWDSVHQTKKITIGIYENLEEAIHEGNDRLKLLSKFYQVRPDDKFKVKGLFGNPTTLVTNTCYPTKGIQYFAKIEKLVFGDLESMIKETFSAFGRYKAHDLAEKSE